MQSRTLWAVVLLAVTASTLRGQDTAAPGKPAESLINTPPGPGEENSKWLKSKLEELDALQREIDQLRRELGQQRQLLISLKCIEVNLTKRDDFGIGVAGMKKLDGLGWSIHSQTYDRILELLLRENIAKVIAEPTMIANVGREASFVSGGEIPVPGSSGQVEYKPFGTRVKLLGVVTPENRIRLELRMELTELDPSNEMIVEGKKYPRLCRRSIDTGIEIAPGEAFLLRGPVETRHQEIVRGDGKTEKSTARFEQLWVIKAAFVDAIDSFDYRPAPTRSAKAKATTKTER